MAAIEVVAIEGRGKGVMASRPVKAGEIILKDSPLLLYSPNPSNSNTNSRLYCANCFINIALPPSITCPSCGLGVVFCSPSCRSIALSTSHSPWVCKALMSLSSFYHHHHHDDFLAQARFLVAAYNLSSYSPANFQLLLSLQGGTNSQPQDQEREQSLSLHSLIASFDPPPSFPLASPGLTIALLAVDKFNAFGLMEPFDPASPSPHRNVRAYAIYPRASSFNHDCLPNACSFDLLDNNAVVAFSNCDIIVRAIHDISQGREICISYFPINWNYADRQRRLREDYGFECHCDRCKVESKWKHQEDDASMEEDENEEFPHAYFFLNFLCDTNNCWGTLAPLPPSEGTPPELKECNVCGRVSATKQDFDDDDDDDDDMQDD